MYEAAVAYHDATGERTLLDAAIKSADLLCDTFGPDGICDVPGHQEIEIGLARLYRKTGDSKYLELAKFFLDMRGRADKRGLYGRPENEGYMQDHAPVIEQSSAVGHSVRAGYMYAGMADIAALTGNQEYIDALDRIWQDVVDGKLYLTGGIGARHEGEAFGEPFELPNRTAYNETCAAIAGIIWNHRMFLLHGNSRYIDVLETTLYNGFLAGVGFSGDTFFYPNPLEWDGAWTFNKGATGRQPWFDCSCCPTNVVRLLGALPGLVYAQADDRVYVNLYAPGTATIDIGGTGLRIVQETEYPWSGSVRIALEPEKSLEMTLMLRIPGWAGQQPLPGGLYRFADPAPGRPSVLLNGVAPESEDADGYVVLRRTWSTGDIVEIDIPIAPRRVVCDERVAENRGRVAIQRGPLVYCFEEEDNGLGVLDLSLAADASLIDASAPGLPTATIAVDAGGVRGIPYYAWSQRTPGKMAVWVRQS